MHEPHGSTPSGAATRSSSTATSACSPAERRPHHHRRLLRLARQRSGDPTIINGYFGLLASGMVTPPSSTATSPRPPAERRHPSSSSTTTSASTPGRWHPSRQQPPQLGRQPSGCTPGAHLAAGMDSCTSMPMSRSHTEPEACSPARRLTSICTHANSYLLCHKLARHLGVLMRKQELQCHAQRAPPLCIDNHLSSAAGGVAPSLCIDNRLSSAAGRAAPPLIIDSISAWPPA